MFIPTMIKEAPGLLAEQYVWDAVTLAFDEQTTLAVHHYPLFFSSNTRRREIDILIINEILGVCVLEVKGININQIKSIQGHQWTYDNFYEEQGSPFQQAENQLNLLCNHLERNPLLYRRFSKRVFIALPYISEKEWIERGFHEYIHIPLPVFKEDLEDVSRLFAKLKSFAITEAAGKLSTLEMAKIYSALGIKIIDTKQGLLANNVAFSHLFIVQSNRDMESFQAKILSSLQQGTKVYILNYSNTQVLNISEYKKYIEAFQLNLFSAQTSVMDPLHPACFTDGENVTDEILTKLSMHFAEFNSGQYRAIHQPLDVHQIITAGAGTGKTHVMIDRILYLLMKGRISLKRITMITFTNASTKEMKKRLEEKFIKLFNLTKNSQFLIYAEEVKDMQISTIHSFARSILTQLAHEIGYGQNVRVRSFIFSKKIIIEELIDEYFSNRSVDIFLDTKIREYEFIDFVHTMWDEMEKKGLTAEEIEKIDWGKVTVKKSQIVNDLLQYIFNNCEYRLDELKRSENKITMGDLIRKLKVFTSNEESMKQLTKEQYIFVDEFQDSDGVQIELLASLQKYLNYRLFVVGDIKQAIYRFRGADYKSFSELQDATKGVSYTRTELQLNYRSSSSLLNQMHPLFERWCKEGWLTYEKTDRLISNQKSQFYNSDWQVGLDIKNDLEKALANLPSKEDKVAFIVRTNRQAKQIKEYCVNKKIPTSENLDGTFFTSIPVYHFKSLIDGLLYSHEPKFIINALQTPFFGYVIPFQSLITFGGHKDKILSFIQLKTNGDLENYVKLLRTLAPMTVIQKIIYDKAFFSRLPAFFEKHLAENNKGEIPSPEEVELAVLRYKKNLQHLMLLIERQFSSQNITLQTLRDWLQLQIKTNRSENEPMLEHSAQVEITTVHRSKGLEYHTVFLPITNSPFNTVEQKYFLEEASDKMKEGQPRRSGWKITVDEKANFAVYQNNYYDVLKEYEDVEQLKEEARLLYVALTRAKQRVYITMPKNNNIKSHTWAFILARGGLLDGREDFE